MIVASQLSKAYGNVVAVDRVSFFADGRLVCAVEKPPFSCPWDAGSGVKEHVIRADDSASNADLAADPCAAGLAGEPPSRTFSHRRRASHYDQK